MKIIFAVLSIISLTACGESVNQTNSTADSAAVSNKIDNTTDKMNGMTDSTKAKMDKMVDSAKNDVRMMNDSIK